MPETYVHPLIVKKCFDLLGAGQFESAVLQAFKVIETTIRNKTAAGDEQVGVRLIRSAFHPETGPLKDASLPRSEREAFANYLAGAVGYYKNPCSHRDIEMDFLAAFERLVVASDLLKIIERAGHSADGGITRRYNSRPLGPGRTSRPPLSLTTKPIGTRL